MGSITTGAEALYRIGVDVGGTNTDAVLLRGYVDKSSDGEIDDLAVMAAVKSPTTRNISDGIFKAIGTLLEKHTVPKEAITSINIGTTHFVNAIIQADASKLEQVAVIRLCGPFCRTPAPFVDFPSRLRNIVEGYSAYASGGTEVDGRIIAEVDKDEIICHAKAITELGISKVVVIAVFAALETTTNQEEQVKGILEAHIPQLQVVCARDMGSGGLIERENAAILNASVLSMAAETIHGFQHAVRELGINCKLYLTQNNGSLLSAAEAGRLPILTFGSGPTNSLTGAIFLSGIKKQSLKNCQVVMVDIGGTTTELAALSSTGLPRPSPVTVKIGGVRTAFQMPEVLSIGLGGGSEVKVDDGGLVSVGPQSVGYRLPELARSFGGTILTATDIVVATGNSDIHAKWAGPPSEEVVNKARASIKKMLEEAIDSMKSSDLDVVVLVVGGGAFLRMDNLDNGRDCLNVPHHDVANAVGAAMAKVSGDVDRITSFNDTSYKELVASLETEAIDKAVRNGARRDRVEVVQLDVLPLPFIGPKTVRAIVKAVGEPSWRTDGKGCDFTTAEIHQAKPLMRKVVSPKLSINDETDPLRRSDLRDYIPRVSKDTGEWFVSATDLAFIALGCSIVATGGGGTVRPTYLDCLEQLKKSPDGMRIIDPLALKDDAIVVPLAYIGAPTVSDERLLSGNEIIESTKILQAYLRLSHIDAFISPEIGGSNGLTALTVGARMGIPAVDADTLGRAYPRVDLGLPYVYKKSVPWPAACVDARGNAQIITNAQSERRFESMARSASTELGLYNSITLAPYSGSVTKHYCVANSLSVSWFIGRAVYLARCGGQDPVAAAISVIPGSRLLFYGKIVRLERRERDGWTVGSVVIEGFDEDEESAQTDTRSVTLAFQNEWLYLARLESDGSITPICTTPDLVTVLDSNGEPLGTHEVRYGLRVSIIGMPAHKLWKTPIGMAAADPMAFGLDMNYTPVGTQWEEFESVISRYG